MNPRSSRTLRKSDLYFAMSISQVFVERGPPI
jgi:hypothetical protein